MVESLGSWSALAEDTLSSVSLLLGQRLGIPLAEAIHHMFQGCAITLWKRNVVPYGFTPAQ